MNDLKKMSNSLEETLKDSDLQNLTTDLAETFADSLLNDGILKDIPIIGTIIGLTKSAISFNDRLFIKKLIFFISELKNTDPLERKRLITEIDESEKHKVKVGEKLLYIIDKCEDHVTSKYVAILFKAFLNEEINYNQFLRCSTIINKIFIEDLEQFILMSVDEIQKTRRHYGTEITDFQFSLINCGICATETERVSVRDQDDYKAQEKYVVDGGDTHVYLTDIGTTLKNILNTTANTP